MTLSEIATKLRITPQAVADTERRALAKIRRVMLARKIVDRNGRRLNV